MRQDWTHDIGTACLPLASPRTREDRSDNTGWSCKAMLDETWQTVIVNVRSTVSSIWKRLIRRYGLRLLSSVSPDKRRLSRLPWLSLLSAASPVWRLTAQRAGEVPSKLVSLLPNGPRLVSGCALAVAKGTDTRAEKHKLKHVKCGWFHNLWRYCVSLWKLWVPQSLLRDARICSWYSACWLVLTDPLMALLFGGDKLCLYEELQNMILTQESKDSVQKFSVLVGSVFFHRPTLFH